MHRRPLTRQAPLARDTLLALYPATLVALTLAALLAPQRAGLLALTQVFAHFLFLPALLLLPIALAPGMVLLRLTLATAAAAFLLVYPPAFGAPAPSPAADTPELGVLSWNLYVGGVTPGALREALAEHQPDVVLLQEADWEALAADGELLAAYPYRRLRPEETAPSLAILSRYPIIDSGVPELPGDVWDMPRLVWARLDLGGQAVTVVNAHPMPPRTFGATCPLLRCYNTGPRDAQITGIRAYVDELQRRYGDPLILAGDMNVSERERAYDDLAAGLSDAHRAAGLGFGASWRPGQLNLPLGLIRIDYLFASPGAVPLTFTTDCARRGSDHCLVAGRFGLVFGADLGAPTRGAATVLPS